MKKGLTLCLFFLITSNFIRSQSLPPVAQALYDEAFLHDSLAVQYAINQGADILPTPDGNSFYIKWFPVGSTPSSTPLIVTLHGSSGYAFPEFFDWHSQAIQHGCGIIALQWYRGDSAGFPNDYFNDTTLYSYIDFALSEFNYPSAKAFLHGFSRGSARSYALNFYDSHGGKNYFCTTLSNAGGAEPSYPLYSDITLGVHGTNVFAGIHFNLFCGGNDPNPNQSGCIGMNNTKNWLQAQGATVDIFIEDDTLGHDGFHTIPMYMDSILDQYLTCYSSQVGIKKIQTVNKVTIFPNPGADFIELSTNENVFKISIINAIGQTLPNITISNSRIDISDLDNGLYFVVIEMKNRETEIHKVIKN
ncbi:MAG: T9SS type A sorting domain-containing protein [Bacteroidota bacterium]|nr:T9SS type A sorting domain-containing protein [Bacteroidota bacterium]